MWHLCSMMSRWLLSDPPNREQKQTTWTPDLLCLERFVFLAAPSSPRQLEKAHNQTDRSTLQLQPPGPQSNPGTCPPLPKKHPTRKQR